MEIVRLPACRGRLARCVRRARATITATDARARHHTTADTETRRVTAHRRRIATQVRHIADRRRHIEGRLLRIAEDHRIARLPLAADRLRTAEVRRRIVQQRRPITVAATAVEDIAAALVAEVAVVPTTVVAAEAVPTVEAAVVDTPRPVEDMADTDNKT